MLSTWAWIAFNLLIYATATLENDTTKAFIELTELGYEDTCHETVEAEWSFINSPKNETLSIWIEKQIAYASFKKVQKYEVGNITKDSINDPSLQYKHDLIEKAGDALLNDKDFETFVRFAGTTELLRNSALHTEMSDAYTRNDVEHILAYTNDIENKSDAWTAWHQQFAPLVKNYSSILPFVEEVAKVNDAKDIGNYWEILSGYDNGYERISDEWSRIISLHKKVTKFAQGSLSHKYGISINDTIPAYLLGSLQGNDWSALAVDASAHPNIVYNIKKSLWKTRLIGKSMYKTASSLGTTLLNQVPQAGFWGESRFNKECPPKLINFCREGTMRVSTCYEPSISNFIAAHKIVGKILYNQMSVEATPVLNTANRYSGLEEGISELFGILSMSPAWLNNTHLIENSTDQEQLSIVSLMITALNVLPRLAYYMSADMWRINAIKEGITEPDALVSSWWKHREEYEGITSNETEVPAFLNDDYIIKNKPYLPKFIGTVFAFQLYEYLMDSTELRYERILEKQINADFIKMIQQGAADDWLKITNKYIDIDEVSMDSLLSFFLPLEEFLSDVDEEFEFQSASEGELDELRRTIIEEMKTPITTTTTTTTTTAAPRRKAENSVKQSTANNTQAEINGVPNSGKTLEPNPLVHEKETVKVEGDKSKAELPHEIPADDCLETESKPKIKSSKAVWAVGSVLVATIVICIIAIFGRQRCRKTPKNRRYV